MQSRDLRPNGQTRICFSPDDGSPFSADSNSSPNPPQEPASDSPFKRPAAEQIDSRPPVRLSIIHLMLLMVAASILMLPTRMSMQQSFGDQNNMRVMMLVYQFASAAFTIVPLTSLMAWALAKIRGERFPAEPGHWLLILQGVTAVGFTIFGMMWYIFGGASMDIDRGIGRVLFLSYAGSMAGYGVIALIIAVAAIKEPRWRVAFGCLAFHDVMSAVQTGLVVVAVSGRPLTWLTTTIGVFTSIANFAAPAAVAVMAIMDLWGPKRDWLHWTGIVCYLLTAGLLLAWLLVTPWLI